MEAEELKKTILEYRRENLGTIQRIVEYIDTNQGYVMASELLHGRIKDTPLREEFKPVPAPEKSTSYASTVIHAPPVLYHLKGNTYWDEFPRYGCFESDRYEFFVFHGKYPCALLGGGRVERREPAPEINFFCHRNPRTKLLDCETGKSS